MIRISFLLVLLFILGSCGREQTIKLKPGIYRAVLDVQDSEELPFLFKVLNEGELQIFNAEEIIEVDDVVYRNDSVYITTPVFEGYIAARFDGEDLKGAFIKESLDRIVPFRAEKGSNARFPVNSKPEFDVSGSWEAVFSPEDPQERYVAKGIFKQEGSKVTGTFRTTTGDYRFLEGVVESDTMRLSAFDGAHAFLFTAKIGDSVMSGTFYSGNHFKEPFRAKRNENFELPDSKSLTFLKEGYEKFSFEFPQSDGQMISLDDDRFRGKVVLVQIMGTWCPNCLDESKYYSEYFRKHSDQDLEIVALAFEYAKTEEKAFQGIDRLRSRLDIPYPILLAQYGSSSKELAQEKLPMLNHVLSYPTTIFIDKKREVRRIHTGFNGPATGSKYLEFKADFESFVDLLLNE